MRTWLLLFLLISQAILPGCAPLRDVGDPIGATVGEVSDELGAERKIGEGEDAIVVHPEGDKKIKMSF